MNWFKKIYFLIFFFLVILGSFYLLASKVNAGCDADPDSASCGECNISGNCGSVWKYCTYTGTDSDTGGSCAYGQNDLCSGDPSSCTKADSCDCNNVTYNEVTCVTGATCTGSYGDSCHYCQTPLCNNNGAQDNGETGIDCGGGGCGVCAPAPTNPPPGGGDTTPTGSISANPNPCTLVLGFDRCSSNISWDSSNTSNVTVCRGASVFATSGSGSHSQYAYWIIPNNNYIFTLYNSNNSCSGTSLATVTVTAIPTCSGNNFFNEPVADQSLVYGTTYKLRGWSTFCSGPNYTNRNRVDMYLYPNPRGPLVTGWGSIPSERRQDVVSASQTCGDKNPNDDGWYKDWTVDQAAGNYTLQVASINDSDAACVEWASQNISITCPTAGTIPACRTSDGNVADGSCGTTPYTANCSTSCSGNTCADPSAPTVSPVACVSTATYTTNISWTNANVCVYSSWIQAVGDVHSNTSINASGGP